ncbi:MAG: MFS transporter [Chloroflexi bacterium]|nr:MFS transporter [Chloroflexota bacterium]
MTDAALAKAADLEVAEELEGPETDNAAVIEPGRTSLLAAFAYRDFRLFWFGLLVSNTGTTMQMFGQGYLVVQLAIRDGTPQLGALYLGLVGLARAVPGLALGLFGGAVADRADRRRLLLATQLCALFTAAVLSWRTISGQVTIVEILLLAALNSTIFSFDAPTRHAMVPRLVGPRHLVSAIGLNSAAFNGPQIIGPVLGGLIVVAVGGSSTSPTMAGIGSLFLVNSLSYLAVVVALLLMRPVPLAVRTRDASVLESIREGLAYVRRDVILFWTVAVAVVSALAARCYIQLLPAFAEHTLRVGAVELSWMLTAAGVGALLGTIATAALGNVRRRGLLLLGGAFLMGLFLVLFSLQRTLLSALPLLALVGFAMMIFLGMLNTLLQTGTPDQLRGRVMSMQTVMMVGLMPLGQLILGSVGTIVGIDVAILAGGAVLMLVVVYVAIRAPQLRELRAVV